MVSARRATDLFVPVARVAGAEIDGDQRVSYIVLLRFFDSHIPENIIENRKPMYTRSTFFGGTHPDGSRTPLVRRPVDIG